MKALIASLAVASAAGMAQAQLTIDVVGNPGDGVTTWTFGGSSVANTDGATRDETGASFNTNDTGQFQFGEDNILNTTYQDAIFLLTGNVTMTVGSSTGNISAIFLDDDGGSADDLGVRTVAPITWIAGEASSWSGSGTVNVDINDFALGTWNLDNQTPFFSTFDAATNTSGVLITFAVPAPGAAAAFGIAGLVGLRRRR